MTCENVIIKCFSLLNEVTYGLRLPSSSFYFQILLLYCVVMSVCGFLMDVYNCDVEYKFSESAWLEEVPLVERAMDTQLATLLPALSVLAGLLSVATIRN